MEVRFTFTIRVPESTPVSALYTAGERAVCAAENAIEAAIEPHAAPGGECRITFVSNPHLEPGRSSK